VPGTVKEKSRRVFFFAEWGSNPVAVTREGLYLEASQIGSEENFDENCVFEKVEAIIFCVRSPERFRSRSFIAAGDDAQHCSRLGTRH